MADWKYVMFEANGAAVPIIFPNLVVHAHIAEGVAHAVRRGVIEAKPNAWSSKPISAGFLNTMIVTGVHGDSESLRGLKSREEDRSIINCWPYAHGMDTVIPNLEQLMFQAVVKGLTES